MRADRLDRVADLDLAPVELWAACRLDRGRDVGGRDRAEQPAAAAGPALQPDPQSGEPLSRSLGVFRAADLAGRTRALDQLDLLLGPAAPAHRQAPGDQVVPSVP